jgi:hypothetical protein
MTKFLFPVCDDDGVNIIESVTANSIEDAKDRVIREYFDIYDDLESDNWEDFLVEMDANYGVIIGDLYDIETL